MRISPANEDAVHEELMRALGMYSANDLKAAFVVVEPGRHRIRRFRS